MRCNNSVAIADSRISGEDKVFASVVHHDGLLNTHADLKDVFGHATFRIANMEEI